MWNVRLILSAQITELALIHNAWIHALYMILALGLLYAKLPPIVLYVAVQVVGQGILTQNVTNVGSKSNISILMHIIIKIF